MALTHRQAYQVLGVPYLSDLQTCKRAYHNLCKQMHPDNVTEAFSEAASNQIALINEAYDLIQKENLQPGRLYASKTAPVSGRTAKVFGNPGAASEARKLKRANEARRSALEKQKSFEIMQEKSRELAQRQKEAKILEQIRWIRLSDIIRKSMEEDARKEELTRKAQEAIRKARKE